MVRLSIITPVFNGIRFIEDCIQNVLHQQCAQAEHIIVDGGSTDGTVDVIRKYAARYTHIQWITGKDRGQSDAMNKGIAMASGDIISFLNIDDFYEETIFNRILQIFDSMPDLTFLTGNCNIWNDAGNLVGVNRAAHMTFQSVYSAIAAGKFNQMLHAFPVNPSCYFYHKAIHNKIGVYDVSDHYTMDFDFIVRLLLDSNIHIEYRDENWGNYRQIAGTKTFNQNVEGSSRSNLMKVLEFHLGNQPLAKRIKLIPLLYSVYSKSNRKFINSIIRMFSLPVPQI
jgi:glycosyltransferase involved in cell wall biosynthesis